MFPKNTPDAIVQKLYDASNRALNQPLTVERLRKTGIEPIPAARRSPAHLREFLKAEMKSWADQVTASGVPLQ
jgi:tripartite-type tricarboxylate transporter receptor subunit TctC